MRALYNQYKANGLNVNTSWAEEVVPANDAAEHVLQCKKEWELQRVKYALLAQRLGQETRSKLTVFLVFFGFAPEPILKGGGAYANCELRNRNYGQQSRA